MRTLVVSRSDPIQPGRGSYGQQGAQTKTHCDDCLNPRRQIARFFWAGILTRHHVIVNSLLIRLTCYDRRTMAYHRMQQSLQQKMVDDGTQRPDRPGFSPEFPLTVSNENKN